MESMPLDDLLNKTGSMYKLVTLTFLRAAELNNGAARLLDAKPEENDVSVALKEILDGRVTYKTREDK